MQRSEQSWGSRWTAGGCLLEQLVPASASVSLVNLAGQKRMATKCPHI
jgi:hypothetical protein